MSRSSSKATVPLPHVAEGDVFRDRKSLCAAGVHRVLQGGIVGNVREGAESIVLSGGYEDNRELANGDIIYTGHGGRDKKTKRQVADQSLEAPGNAGLLVSQIMGLPVRVTKSLSFEQGKKGPAGGYRYCGLYEVIDHWVTHGREHFRVCQFHLRKLAPGQTPSPRPVMPKAAGETKVEATVRQYVEQRRLVRDNAVARRVKELYAHTCQICQGRLVISPAGEAYSEAAHIKPVGKPHEGPDVLANLLCLCPNCHVLFDRGALLIADDFRVVDVLREKVEGSLHVVVDHGIEQEFLRHHRARWPEHVQAL
jgi:putative restriction endonuclease